MKEERQAFATESGELAAAWHIEFGDLQEHNETHPCWNHAKDGGRQETTITVAVEVSKVAFRTNISAIQNGSIGQLSTAGERFHQVTITNVSTSDGFDEVIGLARRTLDYRIKEP